MAWTVLFLVAFVFGGIGLVGSALPRAQTFRHELTLDATPEAVWALIAEDRRQLWRSDLQRVEIHDSARWTEVSKRGPPVRFEQLEAVRATRLRVRFVASGFRGDWVGELEAAGDRGTRLGFEEVVTIDHPLMRALSRIFFRPQQVLEGYVTDLRRAAQVVKPS